MTKKAAALVILVVILSGIGMMSLIKKTSESGRLNCVEYCSSQGMDYVHAPTGTAGSV